MYINSRQSVPTAEQWIALNQMRCGGHIVSLMHHNSWFEIRSHPRIIRLKLFHSPFHTGGDYRLLLLLWASEPKWPWW